MERLTGRMAACLGGLRSRLRSAVDVACYVGVWKFASRVLPWSFRRDYSIYSQDLDNIVPHIPPSIPFRVRPAGMEDVPALLDLRKGYYSRALLEKRLEEGQLALLGWSGDQLVYSHWALSGSIDVPYLHGRLILDPGEVFTDEIFVHPGSRRFGIYGYGSYKIRTAAREKGFRTMYCAIASWNEVPKRIMVHSGMTEIARFRCRNVPGFAAARWSGSVEVKKDGSFSFHASR
jgi:hypothetical protein